MFPDPDRGILGDLSLEVGNAPALSDRDNGVIVESVDKTPAPPPYPYPISVESELFGLQ